MQKYIVKKKVLATFLTFLRFREFSPQYSYKVYFYVKKSVFLVIVRGTTRPSYLMEVMGFFATRNI